METTWAVPLFFIHLSLNLIAFELVSQGYVLFPVLFGVQQMRFFHYKSFLTIYLKRLGVFDHLI